MQNLSPIQNPAHESQAHAARTVYFDLFDGQTSGHQMKNAERFLSDQLAQAEIVNSDLPDDMNQLGAWMEAGVEEVGRQYQEYLEERKAGAGRRYFRTKAHAQYFIKSVAPTKMVDGAWLYGLLPRWQDTRFLALIQTYLEELGEGVPSKNHVVLYKKLLASQGYERWDDLSDEHYVQGALQLALAYHADQFLPEVIGFNLGYEQLPLHLLITAYELKELGIDPYYFTLHITVDNADSGHAKKAVDAIFDAMPKVGDGQEFYRRVQNGYKLNLLGAGTNSVIDAFDLQQELEAIFARKAVIGQYAHSDYRRVAGRTVNEWLSEPEQVPSFIAAMEQSGWFKRHQDPQNSRFWKLIDGEKAKMFGVFSPYEQQVIHDWIAGDAANDFTLNTKSAAHLRPQLSFEAKQRFLHAAQTPNLSDEAENADNDFDAEVRELEERLASTADTNEMMATLVNLMSPANHHTAPGLMATRIFNDILS